MILNQDETGVVFHFSPTCDATGTLSKYKWDLETKKPRVYVFGGDDDDAGSRSLYKDIIFYCRENLLRKQDFVYLVDSSGLLVGSTGEMHVRPADLVGRGGAKK